MSTTLEPLSESDARDTRPQGEGKGPVRPGSDAHKVLFCRTLLDTFNPYKPAVIDWPVLDPEARGRLVTLPIWDIAVQTEGRARLNVAAYAAMVCDPLLKRAIELNAFEEGRHKQVLSNLVAAYGIKLAPEPEYRVQGDPEWAFMVTGYSECIDSFFAFGLFESAKRSGFFPEALVDTFDPVMQEGGAAHSVLRQLGCLASAHDASVAAPLFRAQGAGGVAVSHLGAHRHRTRCGQRRSGQQFHRDRGRATGR
jgi:hypothetical protein